jgi:hypothetical protein
MTEEVKRVEQDDEDRRGYAAIFGAVGLLIVYFLSGLITDTESKLLRELSSYVVCTGVVFLVFYVVFYLSNIHVVRLFRKDAAFAPFLALLLAGIAIAASVDAADEINRVFGLDASAVPNTFRILTFLEIFLMGKKLYWALFIYGSISSIRYLVTGLFFDSSKIALGDVLFALSGVLVGLVALGLVSSKYDRDHLPRRIYLIANSADFYGNVRCPGHTVTGRAIFLGPDQRRILENKSSTPDTSWFQAVYSDDATSDVQIPEFPPQLELHDCAIGS